jgi:DNA-binding PadR family transcriptional regulator
MANPPPQSLLPLPPASFHILVSVADVDRHGYAIIQDIADRTAGRVRLGAGTLYRTIQRLLEDGLILETEERPEPDEDDERRRYYRITAFGRTVVRAEAERLADLVKLARASGLAPKRI